MNNYRENSKNTSFFFSFFYFFLSLFFFFSCFLLAGRGDEESSKASFDRASKNTISTLTVLHLLSCQAAGPTRRKPLGSHSHFRLTPSWSAGLISGAFGATRSTLLADFWCFRVLWLIRMSSIHPPLHFPPYPPTPNPPNPESQWRCRLDILFRGPRRPRLDITDQISLCKSIICSPHTSCCV